MQISSAMLFLATSHVQVWGPSQVGFGFGQVQVVTAQRPSGARLHGPNVGRLPSAHAMLGTSHSVGSHFRTQVRISQAQLPLVSRRHRPVGPPVVPSSHA